MEWKHVLAYITGSVDQERLVRNAYLVTENRILRQQIIGRVQLSNGARKTLAEAKTLSRDAQEQGSAWRVAWLDAAAMPHLSLARLTGVEGIAARRRRARLGDMVATDVAAALVPCRQDVAGLYRMIDITPALVTRAMAFAET